MWGRNYSPETMLLECGRQLSSDVKTQTSEGKIESSRHFSQQWRSIVIVNNVNIIETCDQMCSVQKWKAVSFSEQWCGISIQAGLQLCWYWVELMTKMVWESTGYKHSWKDYRYIECKVFILMHCQSMKKYDILSGPMSSP